MLGGPSGSRTLLYPSDSKEPYLVAGDQKYIILKDSEGDPLTTYEGYSPNFRQVGSTNAWWGKFPAPPPEVKTSRISCPSRTSRSRTGEDAPAGEMGGGSDGAGLLCLGVPVAGRPPGAGPRFTGCRRGGPGGPAEGGDPPDYRRGPPDRGPADRDFRHCGVARGGAAWVAARRPRSARGERRPSSDASGRRALRLRQGDDPGNAVPILEKVAAAARQTGTRPIRVEGHTDAVGQPAYNQRLSQARAQSVVQWLVKGGIPASRLSAQGFGATRPVAPNKTAGGKDDPAGRQKNRRVTVTFQG
ncbi:MAG TPA: OmpA family protein [Allosphingosinicella sp.]